jgi:hypothetical protein
VSNICGTVTSVAAALVVNDPVQITQQPASQTVNPGTAVTFSVTATGTAPLSYQWKKNGVSISGATAASYAIASAQQGDEGSYTCAVSNVCGTVTSAAAALAMSDSLQITQQPRGGTRYVSESFTFSVSVTGGTGVIRYRWQKNGNPISGATRSSHTLTNLALSDAGTYTVTVRDGSGMSPLVSNPAVLVVLPDDLAITVQPQGGQEVVGEPFMFTVTVTGGLGTLSYQWQKDGVDIPGATGSSYAIALLAPEDAGSYSVVVTDSYKTLVISTPAVLEVLVDTLMITQQPQGGEAPAGSAYTFLVLTSGGIGDLSYEWQRDGHPIPGATESWFSIPFVTFEDEGSYTVTVSDGYMVVVSNPAILTVAGSLPATGPEGLVLLLSAIMGSGLCVLRKSGSDSNRDQTTAQELSR